MGPLFLLLHVVFLLFIMLGVIYRIQTATSSQNALGHLASSLTHFPLRLTTELKDDGVRRFENNWYLVREEAAIRKTPDDVLRAEAVVVVSKKTGENKPGLEEILRFTLHEDNTLRDVVLCGRNTTPDGRIVFLIKSIVGEIDRAVAYKRSVALRQQR